MVTLMRAMGMESDQEIMELIGLEPGLAALWLPSCRKAKVLTLTLMMQGRHQHGDCDARNGHGV